MLQLFHADVEKIDLDVAYLAIAIHVCCKCLFIMFHLLQTYVTSIFLNVAYVAVTIHICCKCMFQMFHLLQTYVAGSAFMLQVFLE
jgi:hypothetical protein